MEIGWGEVDRGKDLNAEWTGKKRASQGDEMTKQIRRVIPMLCAKAADDSEQKEEIV